MTTGSEYPYPYAYVSPLGHAAQPLSDLEPRIARVSLQRNAGRSPTLRVAIDIRATGSFGPGKSSV